VSVNWAQIPVSKALPTFDGSRTPATTWRRTLIGLLWTGSLAFACTTVRDAWEARLIVPFWDEWDPLTVYRYIAQSGDVFAELWTPFNGHYEPIPGCCSSAATCCSEAMPSH